MVVREVFFMKYDISADKNSFCVHIQNGISFLGEGVSKKDTCLCPWIKFGPVYLGCGNEAKASKSSKMINSGNGVMQEFIWRFMF